MYFLFPFTPKKPRFALVLNFLSDFSSPPLQYLKSAFYSRNRKEKKKEKKSKKNLFCCLLARFLLFCLCVLLQVQGEARVEAQLARMAATVAVGVVRMVAVQRKENC
ncbi:hypothetical protein ES288_D10G001400v1 [Gossypium darwinii]|uniref:Uncharacterized protein n=1 Tax=Gossypium darwinii TaxID=34276 RepID=A0A5D2ATP0_GOSDA|nr:hypothetical protein ES288_D10G001400v1 [Gossypium darwinii]